MTTAIVEEVTPTGKRCKIEEVFARPFIELIGLAPMNIVVRGLILSQTGKLPGPEQETFEQIKEWVETTCVKKLRVPDFTPSQTGNAFSVRVEFTETENGRASYSVPRSGSDEFHLEEDELVGLVQDAINDGQGFDDVVDNICTLIEDDAWTRCDPNLEDCGDYDYSDHDAGDASNSQVECSKAQIKERLLTFLTQRHPQLLEELT